MSSHTDSTSKWTFVTNHTQVLVYIAQNPDITLRRVAQALGITERATQRIIADLEAGGVIERHRVGRNNHYSINREAALRQAALRHHEVGPLIDLLQPMAPETKS